jgi:hypothetical protein
MTLGKKGTAGDNNPKDALNGPSDVVIAKHGDIFISDGESTNRRVVKFSNDGKFIRSGFERGIIRRSEVAEAMRHLRGSKQV